MGSTLLSQALLDNLHGRWVRADLPCVPHLRPGLSDEEIERVLGARGLRLPIEGQRWWAWHDGVAADAGVSRRITRSFDFLPLEEVAARYDWLRQIAAESAEEARPEHAFQDHWWAPQLWPILVKGHQTVTLDCSVAPGAPSPVRHHEMADLGYGVPEPKADSLGGVVEWWLEAWDRGLYDYSAAEGRWLPTKELRTEEDNRRRLI
jgi:hypothetical protein